MALTRRARMEAAAARAVNTASSLVTRLAAIPGVRPTAAVAGTALVVGVSWGAWVAADLDGLPVLAMLGVAVAAFPCVVGLNSAEFRVQGALLGLRLGAAESVRHVGQATVANMLPVPGGPVLRQGVLVSQGASQRNAVRVQLMTAAWWLSAGLVVAGIGLIAAVDSPWVGAMTLAGGMALGGVGWGMRPRREAQPRQLAWLAVVEVGSVVVGATRLWAMAALLGAGLNAGEAMSMAFTTPAAAALGIFPSGIGAREALVAATAGVIDADAGLMFLAASLERVMSLVAAVPLLVTSLWWRRHPRGASTVSVGDAALHNASSAAAAHPPVPASLSGHDEGVESPP